MHRPTVVHAPRHQILYQTGVHAHAVPKQLVAQAQGVPLRVRQKFGCTAQTIDFRMHRVHGPDHFSAGHHVLVQQPFVQVAERLGGLVDHHQLKRIQTQLLLHQRQLLGGAVHHKLPQVEAFHGVVLGQLVFQTRRFWAGQLPVAFQQGHTRPVLQHQLTQGIGQGVLQVLHRRIDLRLRRYRKLLCQQQHHGFLISIRGHCPRKQLHVAHAVFFLDFHLHGAQPFGAQLLVHLRAVPLVFGFGGIYQPELNQSVFCPEFVQHLQRFALQTLESRGQISFQINGKEQRFFHLFQERQRGFTQRIPLFCGEVPAEMAPLRGHVHRQHHGREHGPVPCGFVAVTAAHEDPASGAQEEGGNSRKVKDVPTVQNATREGEVVLVHAQLEYEELNALKD